MEYDQEIKNHPILNMDINVISPGEYMSFYKLISNSSDYLCLDNKTINGPIELKVLLFLPATPNNEGNLKLYTDRVSLLQDCPKLVPDWLSFLTGVIIVNKINNEIDDLSIVDFIKKNMIKSSLMMFEYMSKDKMIHKVIYNLYSSNIKLGICDENLSICKKYTLSKLLRFRSSMSNNKTNVSIKSYIKKSNHDKVYYSFNENLQINKDYKDHEIIYMTDEIDKVMITYLKNIRYGFICVDLDPNQSNNESISQKY
jgi:molecular chaperone HtpG